MVVTLAACAAIGHGVLLHLVAFGLDLDFDLDLGAFRGLDLHLHGGIGLGQLGLAKRHAVFLEVRDALLQPHVQFVERLLGTVRREFLDHVLFWNARDLERKLTDLDDNVAREKQRAGDSDIGRLAFPSFLKSIESRREGLFGGHESVPRLRQRFHSVR